MFSQMLHDNPKISVEQIATSCEADKDIRAHAMLELQTFVQTNLLEVTRMEKRTTGTVSSMDIFCRIDVGLILTEDGSLNYFVNEVERGPNICLWSGVGFTHLIGEVASELGFMLHSWVRENC